MFLTIEEVYVRLFKQKRQQQEQTTTADSNQFEEENQ